MSVPIETAVKMLQSLPNQAQERVVEQLRELVAEADAEARWDALLGDHPEPMRAGARPARAAHRRGETVPLDLGRMG